MKNNIYLKIIGYILVIASFYYIIRLLMTFEIEWSVLLLPRVILFSVLYIIIGTVSLYISAYIWKRILCLFSKRDISFTVVYPVYMKANIAKYLPGGIMNYVGRNLLLKGMGMSQMQIAGSSIVEIAIGQFSMLAIALLLSHNIIVAVLQEYVFVPGNLFIYIALTLVVAVVVFIVIFLRYKKLSLNDLLQTFLSVDFFKLFFSNSFIYVVVIIITSGSYYLLINTIESVTISQFLVIFGALLLSAVIGVVTPGVPAGIGIREAVFVFIAQDVCDIEVILLMTVLQRVILITSDVIAFIVALILEKLQNRSVQIVDKK